MNANAQSYLRSGVKCQCRPLMCKSCKVETWYIGILIGRIKKCENVRGEPNIKIKLLFRCPASSTRHDSVSSSIWPLQWLSRNTAEVSSSNDHLESQRPFDPYPNANCRQIQLYPSFGDIPGVAD